MPEKERRSRAAAPARGEATAVVHRLSVSPLSLREYDSTGDMARLIVCVRCHEGGRGAGTLAPWWRDGTSTAPAFNVGPREGRPKQLIGSPRKRQRGRVGTRPSAGPKGLAASCGVLGVLLAAIVALGGHVSAASAHAGTSIHLYAPFSGSGSASGLRIARTASGYCWTTSDTDARADAWRCFVGNYIHDPCFANTSHAVQYVLCPLSTPGSRVLRINLTKRLPKRSAATGDPTRFAPWAVQTTSGRWCTILPGATGLIGGLRINYGCTGGGILLGDPKRATSTWTIFYASNFNSRQFVSTSLTAAWW
jgi:hypothetical protein